MKFSAPYFVISVLSTAISFGSALKCYQCSSPRGGDCSGGKLTYYQLHNCPNIGLVDVVQRYCVYTQTRTQVTRACSVSHHGNTCVMVRGHLTCSKTCSTDGCNQFSTASNIKGSVILVTFVLVMLWLLEM